MELLQENSTEKVAEIAGAYFYRKLCRYFYRIFCRNFCRVFAGFSADFFRTGYFKNKFSEGIKRLSVVTSFMKLQLNFEILIFKSCSKR